MLHTKYESSGSCGFGEEDFFLYFPHDTPGAGPVWTPGVRMAGFIKRTIILCYTHESPWPCDFREEDVLPMTPPPSRARARMNPNGTVGRIYKEEHYTLLLTKYESSGPCSFVEEDIFFVFPIVSLWELMTPGAGPFFTPGA